MLHNTITETFNCSCEQFFSIIVDYEKYSDFVPGVNRCQVIHTQGERQLVEYSVFLLKQIVYKLWMEKKTPTQLCWTLESGDLFCCLDGEWKLSDRDGGVQATYSVDIDFKIFIPGFVKKKLMTVHLPNMMKAYQERVKLLFPQ